MKKLLSYLLFSLLLCGGLSAQTVDKEVCPGFTINSTADASAGSEYRWLENGSEIPNATSANYTIPSSQPAGVYTYVRQSKSGDCSDWQNSNAYTVSVGKNNTSGSTATMQDFCPYNYTTNSTWVLTDARADAGSQTYTVRLLADGRFWMVNDLKYPTACNKTTFSGATATGSAGKNGISGFIGDCRNNTQSGAGYLYDWMGAMQDTRLYYLSTANPNCGTNCQGICPDGWHLPANSEFVALNNAVNGGSTTSDAGLRNTSTFNAVYGGVSLNSGSLLSQGSGASYWSSTYYNDYYAYVLSFGSTYVHPSYYNGNYFGNSVRCLRNY